MENNKGNEYRCIEAEFKFRVVYNIFESKVALVLICLTARNQYFLAHLTSML